MISLSYFLWLNYDCILFLKGYFSFENQSIAIVPQKYFHTYYVLGLHRIVNLPDIRLRYPVTTYLVMAGYPGNSALNKKILPYFRVFDYKLITSRYNISSIRFRRHINILQHYSIIKLNLKKYGFWLSQLFFLDIQPDIRYPAFRLSSTCNRLSGATLTITCVNSNTMHCSQNFTCVSCRWNVEGLSE